MANVEGLKHCPNCQALIQRTLCGEIPYCPNLACGDQKGAHDWEFIPIILQIEANRLEQLRRSRASQSGEVLARALRRNRH